MLPSIAVVVAASLAATPCALELPASARPGALVFGRVNTACTVRVGERGVRVGADGAIVFGVDRDATGAVRVVVTPRGGDATTVPLRIVARDWRIERVDGVPQDTVTPPPAIAQRIAREQAAVAAARERDDDRADFRFGFAWPVKGRISGVFGSQRVLNGTPKSPHMGLDIAVPNGTPVAAPADGVITFAAPALYLTGGTLVIDHGHGVSSTFVHLSRIDVAVGARVQQGQRVGAAGMTGRATGPHLHWGMNWFDVRVDPQLLLPAP